MKKISKLFHILLAVIILVPAVAFEANDEMARPLDRVRSINRATKQIIRDGYEYKSEGNFTGWHVDMDESCDWYVKVVGNHNPSHIRVLRCTPHAKGSFMIKSEIEDNERFHPENEDNFFLVQVKDPETGKWHYVNGDESTSSIKVNTNAVDMYWESPQHIKIELVAL